MQLLTQSYEAIELLQIRTELERRGIAVHIADEFTYAIPGMPGAEQPRGVWVADEDVFAAQLVVKDLLGEDRIHRPEPRAARSPKSAAPWTGSRYLSMLIWLAAGLFLLVTVVLSLGDR